MESDPPDSITEKGVTPVCFELTSRPPIAPISGAAVNHEKLQLQAADGARVAAFAATPDAAPKAGIVVLPDVRGLYKFYEELALRFGERGYLAVAIDYYGRTAEDANERGEDFPFSDHVVQNTPETVLADVAAGVEWARRTCDSVFTVGFCYGGRYSWLAATAGLDLAGAVGFYGIPGIRQGVAGPTQHASEIASPILALQAGDDEHIPQEQNEEFEMALRDAGVEYELVVYDGAPHSFFDRKQEEYSAASADAWERVLGFLERHT